MNPVKSGSFLDTGMFMKFVKIFTSDKFSIATGTQFWDYNLYHVILTKLSTKCMRCIYNSSGSVNKKILCHYIEILII